MPDYSKGYVYILRSSNGLIYIGSSTLRVKKRLSTHRNQSKALNKPRCTSCQLFDSDATVGIEVLEHYPCINRKQLYIREQYHIDRHVCVNKVMPGRSKEESDKAWQQSNKDKVNAKNRAWREKHNYVFKDYYEANKDDIAIKAKMRRDVQPIVNCPCGGIYKQYTHNRHFKSKMHLKYLKTNTSN